MVSFFELKNIDSLKAAQQKLETTLEQLEKKFDESTSPSSAKEDLAQTLARYATILQQLDMNEKAVSIYREALRLSPNNPDTLKNYGRLLAHLDRYEQALTPLREALKIDPIDLDTELFIMRLELSLGHPSFACSPILSAC